MGVFGRLAELGPMKVGSSQFSTALRSSVVIQNIIFCFSSAGQCDEHFFVQAAVDVVAMVRYGSQEWPQAAKAANFPVVTSSQELHDLCEVPSINTFILTTWLLLKQAQRNLREGVGRLGPRVKLSQAVSNIQSTN